MRLIVLFNDAMIADVICGEEAVYVGSVEGCRVHIEDRRVAPRQAVIAPGRGGAWILRQLDSICEVRLNGANVTEEAELKGGDEIRVLDYAIRVYPDHDERASTPTLGMSRSQLERFAQAKLPPGAILRRPEEPLSIQPEQLKSVNRHALAVSACQTPSEFMTVVIQAMLEMFAAHRVWIGIRRVGYGSMDYVEGRLMTGQTSDEPELTAQIKPRVLDRAQTVLIPLISSAERVSVLTGPLLGPEGALGMVYLDSGDTGRTFDLRQMDEFVLMLSMCGYHLDAIFRTIARNKAALIEGQVSVAHEIQTRLTPRMLPQSDALVWGAFREPGRQKSGDIYDVVRLANGLVAFMIATTPAEGGLPSMLMTQAQTAFRVACMHNDAPHIFLKSFNFLLYDGRDDHPLNCCAGLVEPSSGRVRYSLAGHLGAFIVSARGEERPLKGEEPLPPLGTSKSVVYPLLKADLEPGETLVLFTPGVTTAKNRQEETFGEQRFVDILCDNFGQLASATLKEMLNDLRAFTEGGSQPEDITVILAHRV